MSEIDPLGPDVAGPDPLGPDPRLAIVLDVDDLELACLMAKAVRPWMGVAKVGIELFATAGPDAVRAMIDLGFEVFVDLKFHDIPTTVGRAAAAVGRIGGRWLTIHTAGGVTMLRAGVEGLAEGSGGTAEVLGVTILTSERDRSPNVLAERVAAARDAGCGGVVCSAADLTVVRNTAPRLARVVPGIRLAGTSPDDQAWPATPEAAIAAGASMLVIGRTVTADVQSYAGVQSHADVQSYADVQSHKAGSEQLEQALARMAERARLLAAAIRSLRPQETPGSS
ncbi:orotidine-5'-phosphate decarboxylase [Candidatus Poriferisocius sp.]|uniref:orotidine-5'-phosphate decarboxylase n=1 Tax=Candidatus Poriferisocius sp. TaxID=3101276 RepID=UPI003B0141B7